jgi:hypothetical protein
VRGVVYETLDGGGLPGRVICTIDVTDQVLVRLDPALSEHPGIQRWDREAFQHRGYVVFLRSSLTQVTR